VAREMGRAVHCSAITIITIEVRRGLSAPVANPVCGFQVVRRLANRSEPRPVANMRVAVTQRIQQDGQWRDGDTSFLKVNVWRGQAEHLADSLGKGDRVMVTGRRRQRSWETAEGDHRSVTEIEADEVNASLKWATAKVERTSQRGNGDRTQGRERQAERGGEFNDAPPF
jgi:single-strand DNA-binding protein